MIQPTRACLRLSRRRLLKGAGAVASVALVAAAVPRKKAKAASRRLRRRPKPPPLDLQTAAFLGVGYWIYTHWSPYPART